MISVEKKISLVFDQLPAIQKTGSFDGFKPVYKWGNEKHLIKQLELFAKENKSPYPLIYQVSNQSTQDLIRNEAKTRLILIIATLNPEDSLLNENRWAMSYSNVLYPVVELIEKAMLKAGIFRYEDSYTMAEYPFYSNNNNGEGNATIEKWDALRLEWDIIIEGNKCINTIRF